MIRILGTILLLAAPAFAQVPNQKPSGSPRVMNLNLVNALVTVGAEELTGVFAFVPPEAAPLAFADYLMRQPDGLKRLIKKAEKDAKKVGGINEWEKKVFLYLVGLNSRPQLPPGVRRVHKKLMGRINELSLRQGMPLNAMTKIQRGGKK